MLTESTLFGIVDKVSQSVFRIKLHEPKDGYYVAFSWGKDSVVVLGLGEKGWREAYRPSQSHRGLTARTDLFHSRALS